MYRIPNGKSLLFGLSFGYKRKCFFINVRPGKKLRIQMHEKFDKLTTLFTADNWVEVTLLEQGEYSVEVHVLATQLKENHLT